MSASTSTVWAAAGINFAGLALVAGLCGLVLTNQFAVAEKLGQQSTAIGTLMTTMTELEKQMTGHSAKLLTVEGKIDVAAMDVGTLLAGAGLPVGKDVELAWIGDQVVVFPKTEDAAVKLRTRGLEAVQLTPSLGGFVTDAATAAIVRDVIENAM